MPASVSDNLFKIRRHAKNLWTGDSLTAGGVEQEYLSILTATQATGEQLELITERLEVLKAIEECMIEEGEPAEKINKIIRILLASKQADI